MQQICKKQRGVVVSSVTAWPCLPENEKSSRGARRCRRRQLIFAVSASQQGHLRNWAVSVIAGASLTQSAVSLRGPNAGLQNHSPVNRSKSVPSAMRLLFSLGGRRNVTPISGVLANRMSMHKTRIAERISSSTLFTNPLTR